MSTYTRHAVTVGVALVVLGALTVGAAAVSGVSVTQLTNSEVDSGQSSTHTLSVEADGISADGTQDVLYVELPNAYAGNMSFSNVEVVNRSSGADVPVSSSTTVVDGPDDDGVAETLMTGVTRDADYETDDVNATYEFSLSHPSVTETTTYDVRILVEDSQTETAETTVEDAITVVAGGSMDGTDSSGDGSDGADTGGDDSDSMADTDGMDATTTAADGPGFTAVAALGALVVGALLLGRRQ